MTNAMPGIGRSSCSTRAVRPISPIRHWPLRRPSQSTDSPPSTLIDASVVRARASLRRHDREHPQLLREHSGGVAVSRWSTTGSRPLNLTRRPVDATEDVQQRIEEFWDSRRRRHRRRERQRWRRQLSGPRIPRRSAAGSGVGLAVSPIWSSRPGAGTTEGACRSSQDSSRTKAGRVERNEQNSGRGAMALAPKLTERLSASRSSTFETSVSSSTASKHWRPWLLI